MISRRDAGAEIDFNTKVAASHAQKGWPRWSKIGYLVPRSSEPVIQSFHLPFSTFRMVRAAALRADIDAAGENTRGRRSSAHFRHYHAATGDILGAD